MDNSSDDAMSLLKDKSLSNAREAELIAALISAVEVLEARIEALELQLIELKSRRHASLPPQQLAERVRQLREGL